MSDYHSEAAFQERMRKRKALDVRMHEHPEVFYHVACMGDWKSVVAEQTTLMSRAGLDKAICSVLGSYEDAETAKAIASFNGVDLRVAHRSADLAEYERPTLEMVHGWSKEHIDDPLAWLIYLHTKGVSCPGDEVKKHWRRIMGREVVALWRRNARLMELADAVGVTWVEGSHPYFAGNFWCARADWVARLPSIAEFRDSLGDLKWWNTPVKKRHYCEMWIGSRWGFHVESFYHHHPIHDHRVFQLELRPT